MLLYLINGKPTILTLSIKYQKHNNNNIIFDKSIYLITQ